ncbi:hypothetical protein EV368DRAFT_86456 [Lentinula lateritia]|nr:hypothetical protein EV368DRAFT_86456 [Lentinula lateritia]
MGEEQLIEWSDRLGHKAVWMADIHLSYTPKQYTQKDHSMIMEQDNSTRMLQELRQLYKRLESMEKWQNNLTALTPGPASMKTHKESSGTVSVQASGPVYSPKLRKTLAYIAPEPCPPTRITSQLQPPSPTHNLLEM